MGKFIGLIITFKWFTSFFWNYFHVCIAVYAIASLRSQINALISRILHYSQKKIEVSRWCRKGNHRRQLCAVNVRKLDSIHDKHSRFSNRQQFQLIRWMWSAHSILWAMKRYGVWWKDGALLFIMSNIMSHYRLKIFPRIQTVCRHYTTHTYTRTHAPLYVILYEISLIYLLCMYVYNVYV